MYTINFWPIFVAAVAAFAIGALWYSPLLFGKEWMALSHTTEADAERMRARGLWKAYLSQFIATLVSMGVLAFMMAAANLLTAIDGAFLAFLLWLGFNAADSVGALLWERKPWKLVLIQSIGSLIALLVAGAIMGAWRS